MIETRLIRDAVAHKLYCQGAKFDELAKMGITREEMEIFLDRRIGYANVNTVCKLRDWLDTDDDGVAELARIYRLGIVGKAVYELLINTCRTDEEMEEAAENITDYLYEMKLLRKGRQ